MDLFFTWWKGPEGWEGYWEYNQASFGPAEVRLWQEGYDRILAQALDHPELDLAQVRLIGPDREKQLAEGPVVAYPLERSLSAHLRDSYRRNADQVALVYRGQNTSYRQFEAGVAKVADHLYRTFGSQGRVVILLERSPQMLYAVHGVAQSGNAYVPIGVDWPASRVADILADIGPCAVLTQASLTGVLAGAPCPVLLVDDLLAGPAVPLPAVEPDPMDALYILYTSGTTGRPKGAELPHNGIVNRLLWMQDAYQLKPGERALLKTP
jgi:non-ribosomal peptide synthetase component F